VDQGLQRGSAPYGQREVATRSELATAQTSRNVPHQSVQLTGETTHRLNGCPLRLTMFALVIDHTNRTLSQLRGILCLSVCGFILLKVRASAKPAAVRVAIAVLPARPPSGPRPCNPLDPVLQSGTSKHGLGRHHTKTAVGHVRLTLLPHPTKKEGLPKLWQH